MVQVNSQQSSVNISVDSSNQASSVGVVTTPSHYTELSRQWAISPTIVNNEDYSSKYYANLSKSYKDGILNDAGFIAVSEDLTSNSSAIKICKNNIGDINACAQYRGYIRIVSNISTDVTEVANIKNDVTNCSQIKTAIQGCYDDRIKISNVYDHLNDIEICSNNSSAINTCKENIYNINTCAREISTIGQKVSKSGDTMTGDLMINKAIPVFYGKSTDLDKSSTTVPQSEKYAAIFQGLDKNNNIVGNFGIGHNTNNDFYINMYLARIIGGIEKTAGFSPIIDANGNDFAWATNGVKQSITNWSFPSTTYTDLSSHWGASGFTVTAPADGWVYLDIQNSGNAFGLLNNITKGFIQISNPFSNYGIFVNVPATKGDIIQVNYNTTSALNEFKFIHAIGG